MTDAEPFYAAIRAAPDDDLPRLVFADWLDENGQPERAEYLRLTCAIAREPDGELKSAWRKRSSELAHAHREAWFGPLLGAFRQHNLERGFIASITGRPAQLYTHAADVDRFAPCLTRAGVAPTGADAGVALGLGFVRRLSHLLLDRVAPGSLDSLTAHVELPNLSELFVQTNGLERLAEGVRFSEWSLVRAAQSLRLSIGFGGIDGADPSRVLVATSCVFLERHLDLPNLQTFRLWGVVEPVAHALVRWPGLRRLTELNLHNCCVSEEALPLLLPKLRDTNIELLRLGGNALSNSAMQQVADTPLPPMLRELRLDRNRIGDRGVELLISSPHLRGDLILHIGNNTFSGRSAARLRERFPNVQF